jgi:BirA family biotin operon repressor/biotin-[acetyl-CoA-carboxylase] ligase
MVTFSAGIEKAINDIPIAAVKYFPRIGSTNDEAKQWARHDAPHLALVIADEQTAGRGRLGRRWHTPPGAALAFTLIFRPEENSREMIRTLNRYTALGTLAVVEALHQEFMLDSLIKWPNDVLLKGKKVAGILTETQWMLTSESPSQLQSILVGIGVNVTAASIPQESDLIFPATCVEAVIGRPVERTELLQHILRHLLDWLPKVGLSEFLDAWESYLAWRGEEVRVLEHNGAVMCEGELHGLAQDGALLIKDASGEMRVINNGEVHLRTIRNSSVDFRTDR